jgi:hypothetical protein
VSSKKKAKKIEPKRLIEEIKESEDEGYDTTKKHYQSSSARKKKQRA